MNDMSLSRLYRRLVSSRPQPDVEAADLVSVADDGARALSERHRDAVVAKLADSARHADLTRMLRALKPESEALATSVGEQRRAAHPQHARGQRPAAGARRGHLHGLRWAAGMAACLAVVLGLWSREHADVAQGVVAGSRTTTLPDTIFASNDRIFSTVDDSRHRGAPSHRGDEVFRGGFAVGG